MGITHALLVDEQGSLHLTRALKQRLHFTEKNVALEELP
jgi:hypothetical protein